MLNIIIIKFTMTNNIHFYRIFKYVSNIRSLEKQNPDYVTIEITPHRLFYHA